MRSLVSRSRKAMTWLSGSAPMKPSAGWPLTKAITAGIDWMPIWPGMAGCSSIFILTSFTLPLAALTAFSSTGVSCLHGPHHGAQKSTSTGWRLDSSMTSLTNVCVVVSLTDVSATAVCASCNMVLALEHDPGKGKPVLRKHHARIKFFPARRPWRVPQAGMRPVRRLNGKKTAQMQSVVPIPPSGLRSAAGARWR